MSRSEMTGGISSVLLSFLLWNVPVCAQIPKPVSTPALQPEVPQDPLGRTTPRGTVFGFLSAARQGEDQRAAQYLNTKARGDAARRNRWSPCPPVPGAVSGDLPANPRAWASWSASAVFT
jgi:hypothetical protein